MKVALEEGLGAPSIEGLGLVITAPRDSSGELETSLTSCSAVLFNQRREV